MVENSSDKPKSSSPRFGLALGGGGARGLAHILMLEALEELGLRPSRLSGTSMGAMVAAAYASGIRASDMREHALKALKSRTEIARRLVGKRGGNVLKFLDFSPRGTTHIDGTNLLDLFLPQGIAHDFEQLDIPLTIVAADYYGRQEKLFTSGPLRSAIAASIALPGLFAPSWDDGKLLVDGTIVNPVPFDRLGEGLDYIFAIDVTGGPAGESDKQPNNIDFLFSSSQIMQHSITQAKLRSTPVDIFISPATDKFRALEFHKSREILEAAEPAKDEFKRALEKLFGTATA